MWAAGRHAAGDSIRWSAKVGSTNAEQEGSGGAGSSSIVASHIPGEPKQAVLLLPVNMTATAGECMQHVVGAWLQSILRKYAQASMSSMHVSTAVPALLNCISILVWHACTYMHAGSHVQKLHMCTHTALCPATDGHQHIYPTPWLSVHRSNRACKDTTPTSKTLQGPHAQSFPLSNHIYPTLT